MVAQPQLPRTHALAAAATALLFEHFTHDASLIPVETYPLWKRQFQRLGARAASAAWYRSGMDQVEIEALRDRIAAEGPLSTHAFDSAAESREMWARKPHKKALEQMWYAGVLATSMRRNFVKYYDLGERVFPPLPPDAPDEAAAGAALCELAMQRLWVASPGEIRKFWEALPQAEVTAWARGSDLVPVRVESADGKWQEALALPDIEARLAAILPPAPQLQIINPFDPAIRDRARLKRIFGFDYTNEMFVPAAKRRWGYYVYPLLEGTALSAGSRPRATGRAARCGSPASGPRTACDGARGARTGCGWSWSASPGSPGCHRRRSARRQLHKAACRRKLPRLFIFTAFGFGAFAAGRGATSTQPARLAAASSSITFIPSSLSFRQGI